MSAFTHLADAKLDIALSVFGIAALHLDLKETPIHGEGTMTSSHEGSYYGRVHYNSLEDLALKKYRVECSTETGRLELKFFQPPDPQPRLAFYSNHPQTGAGKYHGVMHFS